MTTTTHKRADMLRPGDVIRFSQGPEALVVRVHHHASQPNLPGHTTALTLRSAHGRYRTTHIRYSKPGTHFRVVAS